MKRHKILLVLLMVFLVAATARAQQTQQAPPQRGGTTGQAGNEDVLNLIGFLGAAQQQGGLGAGGRGAGGGLGPGTRGGAAPANPPQPNTDPNGPNVVIWEDGRARRVQIKADGAAISAYTQALAVPGGAWWTNTALLTRLGLTDDQKVRIERVYESHRQNLVSSKDNLEKEEAQLAKLLGADSLDRTASVAQIYKVVQARGEMEKTNSLMTFEMREVLTRAQWTQLQAQQPAAGPAYVVSPGVRGGGGGLISTPFGVAPGTVEPAGGTAAPAGTGGQRRGRGQ